MTAFQTTQPTGPQTFIYTRTAQFQVPLTVTASSAYVANNSVGGLIRFNNITGPQHSGVIQNVTVTSLSTQTTAYKLYVFSDNPSSTTIADKATPALNAADVFKLIDVITLGAADSVIGRTINVTNNIGRAFVTPTQTLYGVLVTTGTPTYTSTSDITITLTVLQD